MKKALNETQFRVIAVTDPQSHKQTHKQTNTATNPQTGPITIHCAAKLSAQCNEKSARSLGDANTARWL